MFSGLGFIWRLELFAVHGDLEGKPTAFRGKLLLDKRA